MPDIPRLVDDVIAFLKCEWPDLWTEWCKLAYEISGGHLSNLSPEEVGRRLLSERWPTSFGFNYSLSPLLADHHIRICGRLKDLKNTILERIVDALHSGEARLIDSLGNPVLPNRITRESFKFDSGDVVLNDGTRLSRMRLVLIQARMPPAPPDPGRLVIEEGILEAYEIGWAKDPPDPPNLKKIGPAVQPLLERRGYKHVSRNEIQLIAEETQYEPLRRRSGNAKIGEAEIAAAKNQLTKLKAELAVEKTELAKQFRT
jgi:hypothetical protein